MMNRHGARTSTIVGAVAPVEYSSSAELSDGTFVPMLTLFVPKCW